MDKKHKGFQIFIVGLISVGFVIRCDCFLLEPDSTVKADSNGTKQCFSIGEFLAEKKDLTHQIYQLKHDNDQTITILTEQLKHKLSMIEDRLVQTSKQNESAELLDLKMKYTLMAGNFSKLDLSYRDLQLQYKAQGFEVRRLANLTLQLEKKVSALEKKKKDNQTMNLHIMENQMQSLQRKTSLLTNNQNARNQDFLALYNMTMVSSKNIDQLKKDLSVNSNLTTNRLQKLTNDQNLTYGNVYIEIAKLRDSISENGRKVALTASSGYGSFPGDVVRFTQIYTSIGISDIASFKSTGKFVCEFPGLYYISANLRIKTSSDNAELMLCKNNYIRLAVSVGLYWTGQHGPPSASISAVVDCQKNDTLFLFIDNRLLFRTYSFISIIKIR